MKRKEILVLLLISMIFTLMAGCALTPAVDFGSINVNSSPPRAKVYLDGEYTGQVTPIILTNVEVGKHTIKLDLYHYKIWEDSNVTVNKNETTYLNLHFTYSPELTTILKPGSEEGKDVYVASTLADTNFDEDFLWLGNWHSLVERIYIQFDLNTIPKNARVIDANLTLYQYHSAGTTTLNVGLYQVMDDWDECTITWDMQPTSSSKAETFLIIPDDNFIWRNWGIDDLVQGWLDVSIDNYGMLLKDTDEISIDRLVSFRSSDYTDDPDKCPTLMIKYYIP